MTLEAYNYIITLQTMIDPRLWVTYVVFFVYNYEQNIIITKMRAGDLRHFSRFFIAFQTLRSRSSKVNFFR